MNKEEKNEFLRGIERDIIDELNESFNYEIINSIIDYDAEKITIELDKEVEDELIEEVHQTVFFAMPFNYGKCIAIEGNRIIANLGEEFDEWEQNMILDGYETEEEQYYGIESTHINTIDGSIKSLDELYTTQPFARDSQKYECMVSHFIEKKTECLKELKEVFEKYRTIIEEEENAQNDLKEMKNMLNLF